MPFQKGQSGNPKGRPKGSRHKLTEAFWKDMAEAWETKGAMAIQTVAENDPSTFLRVAASLMPKEAEITLRTLTANQLGDDDLADIAAGSSEGVAETPVDPTQLN